MCCAMISKLCPEREVASRDPGAPDPPVHVRLVEVCGDRADGAQRRLDARQLLVAPPDEVLVVVARHPDARFLQQREAVRWRREQVAHPDQLATAHLLVLTVVPIRSLIHSSCGHELPMNERLCLVSVFIPVRGEQCLHEFHNSLQCSAWS